MIIIFLYDLISDLFCSQNTGSKGAAAALTVSVHLLPVSSSIQTCLGTSESEQQRGMDWCVCERGREREKESCMVSHIGLGIVTVGSRSFRVKSVLSV